MQANVNEAVEAFQSVINGDSEVQRLGDILREMVDVTDGNNDKLKTVKGTLDKLLGVLMAGPDDSKHSGKWRKKATREDIVSPQHTQLSLADVDSPWDDLHFFIDHLGSLRPPHTAPEKPINVGR